MINLFWDDFPELFYSGARQSYLWGLDPTYSLRFDAPRTRLLEQMRTHRRPLQGKALVDAFGARTLALRASRVQRFPELKMPPFREVFRDGGAVLYRIE